MLKDLFFSWPSQQHKPLPVIPSSATLEDLDGHSIEETQCVLGLPEVNRLLLPRLPPVDAAALGFAITSELRGRLADSGEGSMGSKRWGRYMLDLLESAQKGAFGPDMDLSRVATLSGVTDQRLWRDWLRTSGGTDSIPAAAATNSIRFMLGGIHALMNGSRQLARSRLLSDHLLSDLTLCYLLLQGIEIASNISQSASPCHGEEEDVSLLPLRRLLVEKLVSVSNSDATPQCALIATILRDIAETPTSRRTPLLLLKLLLASPFVQVVRCEAESLISFFTTASTDCSTTVVDTIDGVARVDRVDTDVRSILLQLLSEAMSTLSGSGSEAALSEQHGAVLETWRQRALELLDGEGSHNRIAAGLRLATAVLPTSADPYFLSATRLRCQQLSAVLLRAVSDSTQVIDGAASALSELLLLQSATLRCDHNELYRLEHLSDLHASISSLTAQPALLTDLAKSPPHLPLVSSLLLCLHRLWSPRLTRSAAAAEEPIDPWERVAVDLLVAVFVSLSACPSGSPQYPTLRQLGDTAAACVHACFFCRTRTAGQALISSSKLLFPVEYLSAATPTATHAEISLLQLVCTSTTDSTQDSLLPLRISICKLLDVLYTIQFTTRPTGQVVSEREENQDEEQERRLDQKTFESLVGTILSEQLVIVSKTVKKGSLEQRDQQERLTIASMVWLLMLQRVDSAGSGDWTKRAACGHYLSRSGLLPTYLSTALYFIGGLLHKQTDLGDALQHFSPATEQQQQHQSEETTPLDFLLYKVDIHHFHDSKYQTVIDKNLLNWSSYHANHPQVHTLPRDKMERLVAYAVFRTITCMPAMVRDWYNDSETCSRHNNKLITKFVQDRVASHLVRKEILLVELASRNGHLNNGDDGDGELSVKGNSLSREICATYAKEDMRIELTVRLPALYPLKNVEVECTTKFGVNDGRWRRWVLQMIRLLSMQDGAVIDAILMWKKNVEKELEGVEPCPVCYCILHPKHLCLPLMKCSTCLNKFHAPCLYTWFKQSGKSKCVICQQPFFN